MKLATQTRRHFMTELRVSPRDCSDSCTHYQCPISPAAVGVGCQCLRYCYLLENSWPGDLVLPPSSASGSGWLIKHWVDRRAISLPQEGPILQGICTWARLGLVFIEDNILAWLFFPFFSRFSPLLFPQKPPTIQVRLSSLLLLR